MSTALVGIMEAFNADDAFLYHSGVGFAAARVLREETERYHQATYILSSS